MAMFARSDASPLAEWWRTVDRGLLAAALMLLGAGWLLSMSAGPAAAERIGFADPFHFVYRHAAFAAASAVVLVGASMLDARWARRTALIVFLAGWVMMALVLVVGHEAKGAQRWLRFGGSTFQPSEVVKPALLVLTAWLLAQRRAFPGFPWAPTAFIFFAATVGLLLMQPDVGQAALLSASFLVVFWVSGLTFAWAAALLAGGAGLGVGLYHLLPHVKRRVDSFLSPDGYDTYQIDKAREAIERGGLFGVGPGEGRVKYDLPDAHTDFIYAAAAEEFGLVVCALLLVVLATISVKGAMSASGHPDRFARAAGVGLFAMFGLQAAINIAVNISLIPPKGMTLPLVSSGGSSLIGAGFALGLALALTRRAPQASLHRLAVA